MVPLTFGMVIVLEALVGSGTAIVVVYALLVAPSNTSGDAPWILPAETVIEPAHPNLNRSIHICSPPLTVKPLALEMVPLDVVATLPVVEMPILAAKLLPAIVPDAIIV